MNPLGTKLAKSVRQVKTEQKQEAKPTPIPVVEEGAVVREEVERPLPLIPSRRVWPD